MVAKSLQQAFEKASKLSEDEQERFGQWILEELSEREWDRLFADPRSKQVLKRLADEAHQEYLSGETEELDPDKL
jgi:hypothetical protein